MPDIIITVPHEAAQYTGWSAHPVTLGVTRGDGEHYGGAGQELGYVSGGMIESSKTPHPLTRVWVHLDVDELAKLPEVREAVERAALSLPRTDQTNTEAPDVR